MGLRALVAIVPAACWLLAGGTVASATVPVTAPPPVLTPVTINAGAGDQYDPHVSGDWVSYASDTTIRSFNFATGADAPVPLGSSVNDLLADVSGSRIVFSRVTSDRTAVMLFDAATAAAPLEIDAAPGTIRLGSAIGGDTVAYVDFGLQLRGEIVLHDLTGGTSVRVTTDTAWDQNPSVAPDGNVVVWEHCATSPGNCDVWQAVKSGGTWSVAVVADTVSAESNPDTNGAFVVYDSLRAADSDLFWRPVAGGAEQDLQLAGYQQNPSVVGSLILFESRPTLLATSDLFVYDVGTNAMYQLTDTPSVTEQLNDISVLPDGRIHVAWTSDEDGYDQRNVRGATFRLPQVDNCATVANAGQINTDDDSRGDACDPDDDKHHRGRGGELRARPHPRPRRS
jgi:hypothetical protein